MLEGTIRNCPLRTLREKNPKIIQNAQLQYPLIRRCKTLITSPWVPFSNSKSNSLLPFCLFVEFDRNWVLFNLNLETCNQKFFYLRFHRICLFRLFSTLFKLLGKWACQTAWPMCCTSPRLTRGALTSFYLFSADFFRLVQRTLLKSRDWR